MNKAGAASVESHLRECDERFSPRLSDRVDLADYAQKLALFADRFEAWCGGRLVGLVAAYLNNPQNTNGFVSSVSVCPAYERRGVASELMQKCVQFARKKNFKALGLEVAESDLRTQDFYLRHGFTLSGKERSGFLSMELKLIPQ